MDSSLEQALARAAVATPAAAPRAGLDFLRVPLGGLTADALRGMPSVTAMHPVRQTVPRRPVACGDFCGGGLGGDDELDDIENDLASNKEREECASNRIRTLETSQCHRRKQEGAGTELCVQN